MSSNQIWVAGHGFPIEAKCVRWDEAPYMNAHVVGCTTNPRPSHACSGTRPWSAQAKNFSPKRYSERPQLKGRSNDLAAAQAVVRKFVLHLDGCPNAMSCFQTLHNERGLSCHFILDNDGTLYQTLDLVYRGYHAAGFNGDSIGIEISNRGDAKKLPNQYPRGKRNTVTCQINGHIYLAYDFTEAQYATMRALGKALTRALPNIPLDYPQDTPGHQSWVSNEAQARGHFGYLGHYHTTTRKWDPGPFDFKKFCESIRGRMSFPVAPKKGAKPDVPEDTEELAKATKDLYRLDEEVAEGGHFPVGPYGEWKIWHGGVHFKYMGLGEAVYSPFVGRLVLARMVPGLTPIGSKNFVLLRHDLTVGPVSMRFWTLYYHLIYIAPGKEGGPKWLNSDAAKAASGQIWKLDEPIEAGELLGKVGPAGPATSRGAQLHFEVIAKDDSKAKIEQITKKWIFIDGTSGGRVCEDARINDVIDVNPHDGKLSRRELSSFFAATSGKAASDKTALRWLAVYNVSEWTADPDWFESLRPAPDFQDLPKEKVEEIIDQQVTPGLWWTPDAARWAKLPPNGEVYHYHPITFLQFVNEELLAAKALADDGVGAFTQDQASVTPEDVTDDLGDVKGDSFVLDSELKEEDYSEDEEIKFDDLAKGFDD